MIVTFIFNVINYRRTSKIRDDSVKLDEFKRMRTPVDLALGLLGECRLTLRSLEASGALVDAVRDTAGDINREVSVAYNRLEHAFTRFDESEFALGCDWVQSLQDPWEAFVAEMDRVYAPHKSLDQTKEVIRKAADQLGVFISTVNNRLDKELKRYTG
ncbi:MULTISPECIES: hypothetical protein [unclassified Chelatococcus]|uniref:hypothetical protein n=1 Tax=unclassified Chelatococcus TaxID=2638111 RepID=UPI001BD0497D|nr:MULTISPECIES: hypothetical protein [unclassified Chelatococcus]MBS7698674.1 hypothetical protein [Chelatococcus sp. YT9]MBX3554744.1 hypothetical protein [Chelatococcus sp.]